MPRPRVTAQLNALVRGQFDSIDGDSAKKRILIAEITPRLLAIADQHPSQNAAEIFARHWNLVVQEVCRAQQVQMRYAIKRADLYTPVNILEHGFVKRLQHEFAEDAAQYRHLKSQNTQLAHTGLAYKWGQLMQWEALDIESKTGVQAGSDKFDEAFITHVIGKMQSNLSRSNM